MQAVPFSKVGRIYKNGKNNFNWTWTWSPELWFCVNTGKQDQRSHVQVQAPTKFVEGSVTFWINLFDNCEDLFCWWLLCTFLHHLHGFPPCRQVFSDEKVCGVTDHHLRIAATCSLRTNETVLVAYVKEMKETIPSPHKLIVIDLI